MDALAKEVLDVAYDNRCMVDSIKLNASEA